MWDAGERFPHRRRPWVKLAQQSKGCTDALGTDGRQSGGIEADVSDPRPQAHGPVIGLDEVVNQWRDDLDTVCAR